MQFNFVALATVALSTLAAATPTRRNDSGPSNQCNTGTLQCCDSVQPASSDAVSKLLGLLGIDVSSVTALVGVTCTPITVIGAGGTTCSTQPACCTDDSFKGVVALGCTPISLGL